MNDVSNDRIDTSAVSDSYWLKLLYKPERIMAKWTEILHRRTVLFDRTTG